MTIDSRVMGTEGITVGWVGDRHVRVRVGSDSSERSHRRVLGLVESLRRAGLPGLLDMTPAYATVLLTFDVPLGEPLQTLEMVRRAIGELDDRARTRVASRVEIPVCYEPEYGLDMADVSEHLGMSANEITSLHSGVEYTVRFIGFSPGFPYLSGLPDRLTVARLDTPRVRVPAGSVALAGDQAGVYPRATPGGWRIIGRTPRVMFDPTCDRPSLLETGDVVRFVPIGAGEFARLAARGVG